MEEELLPKENVWTRKLVLRGDKKMKEELLALEKALDDLKDRLDQAIEALKDRCKSCDKPLNHDLGGPYCLLCEKLIEDARDIQQEQADALTREEENEANSEAADLAADLDRKYQGQ
jgi:uncharacterized Zn finger protein (UPF0148 family)